MKNPRGLAATLLLLPLAAAAGVHVRGVGITVDDLDKSVAFYQDALGFEKTGESELVGDGIERLSGVFGVVARRARLRLGSEEIELTDFLAPEGRPVPTDSRSNDHWFQHIAIVVSDMDRAYAHLRAHNVRHASAGPQTLPDWNPNAGGISAFYFKDPDGHVLEVIHFPEGKGDPRWRQPSGKLFLGIDHTAIVVDDTEASLAFYRDALGLEVAGSSENHGIEQERLNNVFGARLRITGLKGESGPGVEFLEYLAPQGGRPYPQDLRANDLAHWHTIIGVDSAEETATALPAREGTWVSPGAVPIPGGGGRLAALVADPDGHNVLIIDNPTAR
ncbi:MAG: VOC family protein [Candidatus Sumerlaeia bacterium]|nr:VOC family protein [Candidatus Sumerlaeia bacterium]